MVRNLGVGGLSCMSRSSVDSASSYLFASISANSSEDWSEASAGLAVVGHSFQKSIYVLGSRLECTARFDPSALADRIFNSPPSLLSRLMCYERRYGDPRSLRFRAHVSEVIAAETVLHSGPNNCSREFNTKIL